jgi:hypothetical protein
MKTYYYDVSLIKYRIILKYIFLYLVYTFILFIAYSMLPNTNIESRGIVIIIQLLSISFLFRNYNKHIYHYTHSYIHIKYDSILEIKDNRINYQIEFKSIKNIFKDDLFGFPKLTITTNNSAKVVLLNIQNFDDFIDTFSTISKIKIVYLERNLLILILKFFIIYLPSMIALFFLYDEKFSFLKNILPIIFNLNTIFFVYNISEKKFKGGISNRSARRVMAILIFFIFFQLVQVFSGF